MAWFRWHVLLLLLLVLLLLKTRHGRNSSDCLCEADE
jgi:hypothetical protein